MASREHRRMMERKKAGDKTQAEIRRERHPVFYWITFLVLILVVVAFIGSGIMGGVSRQREKYVFGKYGTEEIEITQGRYTALNYFTSQLNLLDEQAGDNREQTPYLYREAFNNALSHYAILDIAKKSGYQVSKKRLDEGVTSHRAFQTNGHFDEKKYNNISDMEKSLLKKFIGELLIHNQLIEDVFFSQLVSSREVDFYKEMKGTERKFSYISYMYSDFPEEKVLAYGNENAQLFKKMRVSKILLTGSTAKEAENIRSQIENKMKSFEEMAKEKSSDYYAEKGGDMGSQYYYQIKGFIGNEDDVKHVFSLKKDELSKVIQIGENFEIYRCNSEVSEPDFSDSALLETVREYMMKYQKDVIEEYSVELANGFREKSNEAGFEEACRELDKYPPYETDFFPINYLEVFPTKAVKPVETDAPSIMSASGSEDFFLEAFSLGQDEVSNPIRLGDQVVVLRLIEEKTISETEWETENMIFRTSLQYYQNDFYMRQLVTQASMFVLKHFQSHNLLNKLMFFAEERAIPNEYAVTVFLNINSDLEKMIEERKEGKVEDTFEDTLTRLFTSGAR